KYPETDPVEATNFQRLIDDNCIVYINLDSLADSVVGTALGSLFLADLTACAARRHTLGISEPPVAIYVDEAAEVINDPMIQMLSKGRSSGFELTLASQTLADFVARMGDEAKALQVLGNVNCLVAMRVLDDESIEMVTEKFAETNFAESSSS
ncbi:TraM recognition domain-containing protein, partial [Arthrospira platensis SPKY2]